MTELTAEDLQDVLRCLEAAEVKGIASAMRLVVLHNKVGQILQAKVNGDSNRAKSDQSCAGVAAAIDDCIDAGN